MSRILLASDAFWPKIDGVADTSAIVARALVARGHTLAVITSIPGPHRLDGIPVVRVASVPTPGYPDVRLAAPFLRARRVIRRFRPDAALVLTPGPVGLAVTAALPSATRMVHVYTTDIPAYLRDYGLRYLAPAAERLIGRLSRRAAWTLCPTAKVVADLESRGHRRLRVWGRGVDTSLFHPGRRSPAMRARLSDGEPGAPLVLYAGRLAREKSLDVVAEAIRSLPEVRFAIVGDGPLRAALEAELAPHPVVFTGFLRGPELAEAYASADLFAFPSVTETFGQVVIQAMASGVPPIVAEGTAPAEFVSCGEGGLCIPAGDGTALAAALRLLLDDPVRRAAMGAAAVARAGGYSWDALVDELETLLCVERTSAEHRVPSTEWWRTGRPSRR